MSATTTDTLTAPRTSANWPGVVSLGLGIFAIVMSEFLPASLLSPIAGDLGITTGAAGQSVTMTAAAAALTALLISVVLPRTDRRRVILALTLLAVVSDVLVALAPSLSALLAARLLLGIALGGFWALAIAAAAHLVAVDRLGRGLMIVNGGIAVATVVAVPLGAWLGEAWGWRGVFALGAFVATVALIVQTVTLPRIIPPATSGLRALGATLRSGTVLVGLAATLFITGGHYVGFTYIRPIVEALSAVSTAGIALTLLTFGSATVLGTLIAGRLADRALRAGLLLFPVMVGCGMLALLTGGATPAGLIVAAVLWGFGFGGVPTSLQTWGRSHNRRDSNRSAGCSS